MRLLAPLVFAALVNAANHDDLKQLNRRSGFQIVKRQAANTTSSSSAVGSSTTPKTTTNTTSSAITITTSSSTVSTTSATDSSVSTTSATDSSVSSGSTGTATSTSSTAYSTSTFNAFPFFPGFDVQKVVAIAEQLPSHSWEFGTATEALLELYNPELSVFGRKPFPVPTLDPSTVDSLVYASSKFVLGTGQDGFDPGSGAVGDPASLGVAAVMLGKTNDTLKTASDNEVDYLTTQAPRFYNGAISQRADVPELWADFIYMAPPFLAYYAADANNYTLLNDTVYQCYYYRQVLQANITYGIPYKGVWEHIIGPQSQDVGLWSTGNGWAAAGMTRVLATVQKAVLPSYLEGWRQNAVDSLSSWIQEILDGAMGAPTDQSLLRNYLNDTTGDGHGFGETSGSSLIASVAYRMAVINPQRFGAEYITWADGIRGVLGGVDDNGNPHITTNGTVTPAVNPLGWQDTNPWTAGSPEGNNFVVLMYAAWRDCVLANICPRAY